MTRKAAKVELSRIPPPGPDWSYSEPKESKDGKSVWIDAHQLTMLTEHYRIAGLPLPGEPNPRKRRSR